MKKIYTILVGALITTGLLSSCNKEKNDWNLNDAPSVVLDSIVVNGVTLTAADLASGKVSTVDTVGVVPVQMYFTAKAGNDLEQISFHDGTWGGDNMTMMIGSETVAVATPPASKYRMDGQGKKELSFIINFADFGFHTPIKDDENDPDLITGYVDPVDMVFSMFVFDGNGLSADFEYSLRVPTDVAN